jgi:hypothetical protein
MDARGPLFDGQAAVAAEHLCREIEREVAGEGVSVVRQRLSQVLKNPTGFYSSKIRDEPFAGHMKVTGENVIYHWWLEGKGSRNFPATRFKGYRTFEIATELLRVRAGDVAQSVTSPYVKRMG